MAVIRAQVGVLPTFRDFPVPPLLWNQGQKKWLAPAFFLCCTGWAAEILIHTEEALYWLRLVRLEPGSPPWFRSTHFKLVVVFSLLTLIFLFVTCGVLLDNPPLLGSILVTFLDVTTALQNCVFTLYVNRRFPLFIEHLQLSGANRRLLQRFSRFDSLNWLRVWVRWILSLAVLIMGIDGLTLRVVNLRPWAVDLIVVTALQAYAISSCLTIVIFLPLPTKYDTPDSNPSLRDPQESWLPPPTPTTPLPAGLFLPPPIPPPTTSLPPLPPRALRHTGPSQTPLLLKGTNPPSSSHFPSRGPSLMDLPTISRRSTLMDMREAWSRGEAASGWNGEREREGERQEMQEVQHQERVIHPYASSLSLRKRYAGGGSGDTGFASSGIHPDVLGYASPIDISDWQANVVSETKGEVEVVVGDGE